MRLKLCIIAIFLLAACAPSQSSKSNDAKPASPTFNQDAAGCERKAALAGVGARAKAFDECMRAGRAPAQ
jgi:hypothetical protein